MPIRTKFIDYDAHPEPKTARWCIACQKDLKPGQPARLVYVTADYHAVHPDDMRNRPPLASDFGWRHIGPTCAKRLGFKWTTREALTDVETTPPEPKDQRR